MSEDVNQDDRRRIPAGEYQRRTQQADGSSVDISEEAEGAMGDAFDRVQRELSSFITPGASKQGSAQQGLEAMKAVYLPAIGLDAHTLDSLNVIHIAGTKGKGSTCAFSDSILRSAGITTGLFTSPHLVDVRERIRINGYPISKLEFAHLFDQNVPLIRNACSQSSTPLPGYFRLLALLALKHFANTGVEASVIEVGMGGRLDATNVISKPLALGITALGYDHTAVLGSTLTQIAREKAGIMRPDQAVYTPSSQPDEAMRSLQQCASDFDAQLVQCEALSSDWPCGLPGEHQRENASIAVHLTKRWWVMSGRSELALDSSTIEHGLALTRWPGRGQIVQLDENLPNATLLLDGAHTPESCEQCGNWFATAESESSALSTPGASQVKSLQSDASVERVLLFHCKPERDARSLLSPLAHALEKGNALPHAAMFPPPEPDSGPLAANAQASNDDQLAWQQTLRSEWDNIASSALRAPSSSGSLSICPATLSDALGEITKKARGGSHVRVLVTGSLYLVGDVLRILKKAPATP